MNVLLIENIFFMNILQYFSSNNSMKISLHEIKNQINIFIILCSDQMLQTNYIWMTIKLTKENNLAESSLSVSSILKGIKDFFDCYYIFVLFIYCLPNNSISAFPKFLKYLKFMKNVWLNFLRHFSLYIVKYNKPVYKLIYKN